MTRPERSPAAPLHSRSTHDREGGPRSAVAGRRAARLRLLVAAILSPIVVLAVGLALMAWMPGRVRPRAWTPAPTPTFAGALAIDEALAVGPRLDPGGPGPEAFAIGRDGAIYAGLLDGRIVRFLPAATTPPAGAGGLEDEPPQQPGTQADAEAAAAALLTAIEAGAAPIVETVIDLPGGRPLGMAFHPDGGLVVADAWLGLVEVDVAAGTWRVLVAGDDEGRFGFADDLAIGSDGTIYFTDATRKWNLETYPISLLELTGDGRVYAWHPDEGRLERLADGLQFANGIALTPDESALLVTETGAYRLVRIDLSAGERGKLSVLADNLPGYPDNIRVDSKGSAWIAMASLRKPIADRLHPYPALKRIICRLPQFMWPAPTNYGLVLRVDATTGAVQDALHDPTGEHAPLISTAHPLADAWLLLGSFKRGHIAAVRLPDDH